MSVSYNLHIRVQLVSVCPYTIAYLHESEQPGIYNRHIDSTSPEVDLVRIEWLGVVEGAVLQVQDAATDTLRYDVSKDWAVYRMVYLIRQHIEVCWHVYTCTYYKWFVFMRR